MTKIVIPQNLDLFPDQIERLKSLGEAEIHLDYPKSSEEWLARCQNADIVCSESVFMETEVYKLENKFFAIPMVGYSWLDVEKMKERNITLANCPGCNKNAVTEWIVFMMINLLRNFKLFLNTERASEKLDRPGFGLKDKKVTILGKGNIGKLVGQICELFGMKVSYFLKGNNLEEKTKSADIVINCLSTNPTTIGLLDKKFFQNLKKNSYFISISTCDVFDTEAMLEALNQEILAGVAIDNASSGPRDTDDEHYKKIINHPKVLVTPHIAFFADTTFRDANDIMIDNVEAWIKGKPINIVT